MTSVDEAVVARLLSEKRRSLQVLDIGVSSGGTSQDLLNNLAKSGITAELVGIDRYLNGSIVALGRFFRVLTESSGVPLQFEVFGIGFKNWNSRRDYFLGNFIVLAAVRAIFYGFYRRRFEKNLVIAGDANVTAIKFLEPDVAADRRLTFMQEDIFTLTSVPSRSFDVVRAANILNRSYFGEGEIQAAIGVLKSKLRDETSLLVVCRTTHDGINHGSIF